ncbi:hypothetical protein F7725_015001 [Dissostichus mawsoni]|uniref:Uncharacterized protein n=1 Tax=Dissostichus mawsoni TaxID=36200 RepID=A0A7J5YGB1_DISMA|nr:hypothetical protein F7725_015001 [Dissostichus mawsoni]
MYPELEHSRTIYVTEQMKVVSRRGGNATLPCKIQMDQSMTPSRKMRIKWTKMTSDYLKESSSPMDASLVITEITLEDYGRYNVSSSRTPRLGRYNLNFYDAERACRDQDAVVASFDQLYDAWRGKLDWCNAGWLSDGSVQYPITNPREPCGGKNIAPGVRNYGLRDKDKNHYDVFCFTSHYKETDAFRQPSQSSRQITSSTDKQIICTYAQHKSTDCAMDRRTNQNQRGNPRPFDHGAVADRAYRQIHCRNGWIYGLDEFHMALGEERAGFGHRMRKEKDNVKRLEDILSNRNSGFDQDNKRLFDIIQYRVADISRLKEQMEAAESQHKQQLDDMVAQQQKLSDQNNEGNLVTFNLLQRREQELLQCEEKFTKNLAEKQDIWESEKLQMERKYEEVTQEKNDLDRKILSRDTEFQQLEAKLKQVEQQKNYLAKKNKSCETDVKQLKDQMREQEEMFSKDLAQNQESCEAKVNLVEIKLKEVTQEKDDLAEKQLSWEKDLKEVQAELKMAEDEKKDSAKKNLSLEKEVQLKDGRVQQLVNELDEQKERFSKDLAEKQLSWELFVQQREKLVKQLENKLDEQEEKFSKDLAQNQESWEAKFGLVETKLKEVTQQKDDLAQKPRAERPNLNRWRRN